MRTGEPQPIWSVFSGMRIHSAGNLYLNWVCTAPANKQEGVRIILMGLMVTLPSHTALDTWLSWHVQGGGSPRHRGERGRGKELTLEGCSMGLGVAYGLNP